MTRLAVCCTLAVLGARTLFAAVDATWIGGASGNWTDGGNWSGGTYPNGKDDVARIVATAETTISLSSDIKLAELHVSGANVSVTGGRFLMDTSAASKEVIVDVGSEVLFTSVASFRGGTATTYKFVKTGGGELKVTTNGIGSGSAFDGIDVRGGILRIAWGNHTDGVKPNGKIHIASGAKIVIACQNCIENNVIVDIDEGGVFDQAGQSECMGGFTGKGLATNIWSNLTLGGGPHRFDGIMAGSAMIKAASSGLGIDTADHTRMIIGTRYTAANASILCDYSENAGRTICPIMFAADAGGVFDVKNASWRSEAPIVLEDEDGNPVTVRFLSDMSAKAMTGKGSYFKNNATTYTVTNDLLTIGGRLLTISPASGSQNYINIGDGNPAHDAVVTSMEGIDLSAGVTLIYKNVTNEDWGATEITGAGSVFIQSANSWTVPLSFGGTAGDIWWSQGVSEGSTLTIPGGRCTAWLNMNNVTNVTLRITGGDHDFRGRAKASRNRKYEQTGGIARFNPISSYDYDYTDNEIFYTLSGGEFYSFTSTTYCRGLGMDISGDAKAYLRVGDNYYGPHRISSDGESHSMVLRDNALLDVDKLNWVSGGTTEDYHTTFELLGGTLRVRDYVAVLSEGLASYPHFTGRFLFDGGWVETTQTSDQIWKLSPDYSNGAMTTGYVGRAGMKWRSKNGKLARYTYFKAPLVSGVEEGQTDGGLLKTGRGTLLTYGDSSYNGPTRVFGGALRSGYDQSSAGTSTPFGTGDVEIEDSVLALYSPSATQTLASGTGATFSYGGGSSLTFCGASSAAVTIGPADAAQDAALVRSGHGVLTIGSRDLAAPVLGTSHKVLVNGGMSNDPNTGLVAAPVFGAFAEGSSGWWQLQLLTYDATVGLKAATCVEGLGGGANSVARISSTPVTLTENAHVGALDLRYKNGKTGNGGLTIASGVTLTVGNGAGTYAPILFNNTNGGSSTPSQTLQGGTVDFGAAEGVLVFNLSYYYGWWRPAQISSVLAGSGGLTLAGIGETINFRSEVELSGVNTYTGGTWIESVGVKPMKNGVFSSGPITITGNAANGGGIWVCPESTMTQIDNPITVSGVGRYGDSRSNIGTFQEPDYGAIRTDRSLSVNGAVTLAGDTFVRTVGLSTIATYAGGIGGAGDLTVAGTGTTKFTHENGYKGRTIVEGVLEIAQGGTLGDGAVEVAEGGTLRFANTSAITVTNDISGVGRIVLAGAPVSFTGNVSFTGEIVEKNQAATGDDLVKDGDDTLFLGVKQVYSGDTLVMGGTLALGRAASDTVPFAEDVLVRLDATDRSTFTFNTEASSTNISEWVDADGRGLVYSNSTSEEQPFLNEGAINGRDAVFFHGNRSRLATTTTIDPKAVFAVTRMSNTPHPIGWGCAGLFGASGYDCGIRCDNGNDRNWQKDNWLKFGDVRQNGVNGTHWEWNIAYVDSFVMGGVDITAVPTAVGDYWHHATNKRGIRGDVGEVIVYGRTLDLDETAAVEAYLAKKWGIAITDSWTSAPEDVLPVGTDVTVAEGAVLDLCGATQTVRTVSGAGLVTNSAPTRALLRVTEDTAMTWDFGGDIALYVADGATLDLCGKAVVVAEVGGSGRIVNGTLVVSGEIQPGGVGAVGELVLSSAPFLDGATLVVDGDGTGACDRLVVEAPFSLAGLSLRVSDFSRVGAYISTIVTAQSLDGVFDADNIVNRKAWRVKYSDSSAALVHASGTTLIIR